MSHKHCGEHRHGRDSHRHDHHAAPPVEAGVRHVGHRHEGMAEDYKRRLVVSSVLTVPVILLSPSIQSFLGYRVDVPGASVLLWALSTVIYAYGGYPFLRGLVVEVRRRLPGMMTLVGVAISVAYFYSTAVTFLVKGQMFFWELATLIDQARGQGAR